MKVDCDSTLRERKLRAEIQEEHLLLLLLLLLSFDSFCSCFWILVLLFFPSVAVVVDLIIILDFIEVFISFIYVFLPLSWIFEVLCSFLPFLIIFACFSCCSFPVVGIL